MMLYVVMLCYIILCILLLFFTNSYKLFNCFLQEMFKKLKIIKDNCDSCIFPSLYCDYCLFFPPLWWFLWLLFWLNCFWSGAYGMLWLRRVSEWDGRVGFKSWLISYVKLTGGVLLLHLLLRLHSVDSS